jgi:biopolymer transport protein ExbD
MALMSAERDEVMTEINITPLTDVLLVLLIIFMILAALTTPPGFQKSLGDHGSDNPPPVVAKSISVLVNAAGSIYINDRRTNDAAIYSDMAAARKHFGNIHVSLSADVRAPYSSVIRVLDAARVSGLEDIGFAT